ncbi:hypothetical protein BHE90_016675 [Fusarium euwallaceae]|uniref:Uncharacterized protein n=1 Tax=Fusarium euwallaceae TaxID=1147111 RepID=A0A430KZQ8_9HYPO|nr:hypothetical protein BHE90_016675 [Fusarium euwallaceae]
MISRRVCTCDVPWLCELCMIAANPPLAATLAYMYAMLPGFIGPSAFASRTNLTIISLASSASFATALAVFAASMFSLISVAIFRIDLLVLLSLLASCSCRFLSRGGCSQFEVGNILQFRDESHGLNKATMSS